MKKYAFLAALENLLDSLPEQERDDALNYYAEYIDAAGKENEARTIAALGTPEEVARQILQGEDTEASVSQTAPPPPPEPQPIPPQPELVTPPAGPEPPRPEFSAADAQPRKQRNFLLLRNPPRPFNRLGWGIFLIVLGVALFVQLGVLLLAAFNFSFLRSNGDSVSIIDEGEVLFYSRVEPQLLEDQSTTVIDAIEIEGWNLSELDSSLLECVQSLRIAVEDADLNVEYDPNAQGPELTVTGSNAVNYGAFVREEDGERTFVLQEYHGILTPDGERTGITVTLPAGFQGLTISMESGNVTINDVVLPRLEVSLSSGHIYIQNVTVRNLMAYNESGNISMLDANGVNGDQTLDLVAPNGHIGVSINARAELYQKYLNSDKGSVTLDGTDVGSTCTTTSTTATRSLRADAGGDVSVRFAP